MFDDGAETTVVRYVHNWRFVTLSLTRRIRHARARLARGGPLRAATTGSVAGGRAPYYRGGHCGPQQMPACAAVGSARRRRGALAFPPNTPLRIACPLVLLPEQTTQ